MGRLWNELFPSASNLRRYHAILTDIPSLLLPEKASSAKHLTDQECEVKMNLQLKKCTIEDLSVLRDFSESMYFHTFKGMCAPEDMDAYLRDAFNEERILKELLDPCSEFWLLYADDQLAGYMKLNEAPAQTDLHDPDSLELERIYVSNDWQGAGLGAFLMEKAVEMAENRSRKYLWLGVWEKNTNAIGFYKRFGFSEMAVHPFVMGEEVQKDYIMCRELRDGERR